MDRAEQVDQSKHHLGALAKLKEMLPLTLTDKIPRKEYQKFRAGDPHGYHWGQRKLFIGELQFMTMYGHLSDVIVYAGAAEGTHIPYLASLFPNKYWILIDPRPFVFLSGTVFKHVHNCEEVSIAAEEAGEPKSHIFTINAYFDDQMAKCFSKFNPIFISDIRSDAKNESNILQDNCNQVRWHKLINSKASSLKYRCLYPQSGHKIQALNKTKCSEMPDPKRAFNDATPFPKGERYFQSWAPRSSSETRVFVTDKNPEMYMFDNHLYEDQLHFFNRVIRVSQFPQPVKSNPGDGLDISYDSAKEVLTIYDYLVVSGKANLDVLKQISDFSFNITKRIHNTRTLKTLRSTHGEDQNEIE